MGSADYYKPGAFNRICDRTGFKVKSTDTRKEWTNAIVRSESWEERHPQDFVRGKKDNQSVPDARSRQPDVFVGPLFTKIKTQAEPGDNVLVVDSTTRFFAGDTLQIYYKSGDMVRVTVQSVDNDTDLALTTSVERVVEVGSLVVNLNAISDVTVD